MTQSSIVAGAPRYANQNPGPQKLVLDKPGVLASARIGDLGICDIACQDPMLAYSLLQPVISGDLVGAYGGLEIINLVGEFTSGEANQTISARQTGIVSGDFWIRRVEYTVRRPNFAPGNIFKGQSDHFNAENPNVDFELMINAYCKYVIASDPTPLENIELAFECCPVQIVLGCGATFAARYTLNRALTETEIPYEVIISLIGMLLPSSYGMLERVSCIEALQKWHILPAAA